MEELKLKRNSIIAALLYAVVTFICVLHHEIWSDEAQVWLLCKHISLPELFSHLTNEGHPSFFYLLVMPFAKLFKSAIWMQLICWLSSVAAVFLLWRYAPFRLYTKLAITLSAPFIYFYPVVARSYSIIPLLIFLLAIFQNKTKEHPYLYSLVLVALLNTHAIMAGFCFLLGLNFVYENLYLPFKKGKFEKKYLYAAIIMFSGGLALVAQLLGTTNSNAFITFRETDYLADFSRIVMLFLFNSLSSYYIQSHSQYFNNPVMNVAIVSLFVLFVSLLVNLFKNGKKYFFIFVLSFAFQIAIYLCAYSRLIFPTRIFTSWCLLLFCFWAMCNEGVFVEKFITKKKTTNLLLAVFFAFIIPNGVLAYFADIFFDYTSSKRTAMFIESNIDPDKSLFITDYPYHVIAVNYYLDLKYDVHSVHDGKRFKYIYWDKNITTRLTEEYWRGYIENLRKVIPNKELYVITSYNPFEKLSKEGDIWEDFDLLYVSGTSIEPYEKYKLYRYKK